jgi:hypothetical protein
VRIERRYCGDCKRNVGAVYQPTGLAFGLPGCLATILTGGLFIALWAILRLVTGVTRSGQSQWTCPECGRRL